ncbi:MAG: hypothetical protein P8R42_28325 [Candidatus Binatia bacterium]|nr:hypothetical protein [Candidatus Binatia bacterium]
MPATRRHRRNSTCLIGNAAPGVASLHCHYLLDDPGHIHRTLGSNSRFPGLSSRGVTPGAWLGDTAANSAAVVDLVEEGDLASRYGTTLFSHPVDGTGPP